VIGLIALGVGLGIGFLPLAIGGLIFGKALLGAAKILIHYAEIKLYDDIAEIAKKAVFHRSEMIKYRELGPDYAIYDCAHSLAYAQQIEELSKLSQTSFEPLPDYTFWNILNFRFDSEGKQELLIECPDAEKDLVVRFEKASADFTERNEGAVDIGPYYL
jgi:hypothetical protein